MTYSRKLNNRIFTATMCSDWEQIADKYNTGIEIDHYCQTANMDGEQGSRTHAAVAEIVRTRNAQIMHAPFNELFPASIDLKARALAMERLNSAAAIAADFGIRKMIVHSGYVPFVYFKEWHVNKSIEFWKEFIEDKPADFEVCIENVLDDEPYMLAEIVKGIGDSRIGVCYDTGHANIAGKGCPDGREETTDQDEWLEVLAPYIRHLHIHNNDGKRDYHRTFSDGTIDIERLLDGVINKCSADTTITAELIDGAEGFRWLKERGFI